MALTHQQLRGAQVFTSAHNDLAYFLSPDDTLGDWEVTVAGTEKIFISSATALEWITNDMLSRGADATDLIYDLISLNSRWGHPYMIGTGLSDNITVTSAL